MSWFGERPEWTGADQRVRNADESAQKVAQSYQSRHEEITTHPRYAEVCAQIPRLVEITEQLVHDIETVIKEDQRRRYNMCLLLKLEERTVHAQETEEWTAAIYTRSLNYNRCIIALGSWESNDLPEARRYIQDAYFSLFPERLPQPTQTTGAFILTCRHLDSPVQSDAFSHHPTRDAAIEYAQVLAQARQATLADWDTWIHPDGKEVIRTYDDQEMSYRIAPNPYDQVSKPADRPMPN